MFVFVLIIGAAVAAAVLLSGGSPESLKDKYCRLECKESKIKDYSICC